MHFFTTHSENLFTIILQLIPTKLLYRGCVEVKRVFLASSNRTASVLGGNGRPLLLVGGRGGSDVGQEGQQGTGSWGVGCDATQPRHTRYIAVKSVVSTFYAV